MRKKPSDFSSMMPDYPRTLHLPYNPNAQRDDLIADEKDVQDIFVSEHTYIEEKIDGANCAMMLLSEDGEENPVIRNRSHILVKGFMKATPAKYQFSSIWNWFYDNKHKFEAINDLFGMCVGVYGEWLYALHGIRYDKLPNLFMAFDIYDHEKGYYLDTGLSRDLLHQAGFDVVPLLHKGPVESYEQLEAFCQEPSPFASERREGVYVKVTDGEKVIKRFKMVRKDFIQGCHWSDRAITRNKVLRG
jgi:atypical dual specificity phosphatase